MLAIEDFSTSDHSVQPRDLMNLTKEEIEEINEALEVHESFLKGVVNGTDIRAIETNDTESARKRIEMIHSIKNKLDNAHVIYLWRE